MRTSVTSIAMVVCILAAGVSTSQAILVDNDIFPFGGGMYVSQNATTFGSFDTEIVSMSLVSPKPLNTISLTALPDNGTFRVDSFFDVFVEVDLGGGPYHIDSFFDVFVEVDIRRGSDSGTFETEIVSMSLTGDVGGAPIMLRESTTLSSGGEVKVTDLGNGRFEVDSFFDVFFEISIDGEPSIPADGPVRMELVPEPVIPEPITLVAVGSGVAALGGYVRRRRRA